MKAGPLEQVQIRKIKYNIKNNVEKRNNFIINFRRKNILSFNHKLPGIILKDVLHFNSMLENTRTVHFFLNCMYVYGTLCI